MPAPPKGQRVSDSPMQPLTKRVLEAVAAGMGIDEGKGFQNLHLEFEGGTLRRWSRLDERNAPSLLERYDEGVRYELARVMKGAGLRELLEE